MQREETRAVLMESNGSGVRYGFNEEALRTTMKEHGFLECRYRPFDRRLVDCEGDRGSNTLYVKDVAWAQERLSGADCFSVLDINV